MSTPVLHRVGAGQGLHSFAGKCYYKDVKGGGQNRRGFVNTYCDIDFLRPGNDWRNNSNEKTAKCVSHKMPAL